MQPAAGTLAPVRPNLANVKLPSSCPTVFASELLKDSACDLFRCLADMKMRLRCSLGVQQWWRGRAAGFLGPFTPAKRARQPRKMRDKDEKTRNQTR